LKVVLFGATGMIGTGVLIECLAEPRVESVLAIGRSSCGRSHAKLRELIRSDFFDYSDIRGDLAGHDACFFCLGVSSAGMDEESYRRITFDVTVAAADVLAEVAPSMVFCYVSGEGTDSTEQGRSMWARVKGKTENHILQMPLDAYMFRPGYVQPLNGARSKTRLYRALYRVSSGLYPLLERAMPAHVTTTERVGRAMIEVAASGYTKRVLENSDINALAASVEFA
jgi:uncharacterized protein YbjT (DUF2867 family)